MKKIFVLFVLFTVAIVLHGKEPKYIFLFIGDGMAMPQRMISEEFSRKIGRGDLLMNHFPFHATTRTSSANALITDSAAAATAIACGEKTNNHMVGVSPSGKKLQSVAEAARDKGKKVGIITTVNLNHATPAGFYAHRSNRADYYNIALDLIASNFDFFGGGGILRYNEKNKENIYSLAEKAGYKVAIGKKEISALVPGSKIIALAGSKSDNMPYSIDTEKNDIQLAEIVGKAINVLDNPNGFFIMVEGGAIDWAGHANEAAANLRDVLALDEAVKTAFEFYKKHPEDTLIVVTGDHETGAMTMGFAGSGYNMNLNVVAGQKCSIGSFASHFSNAKKVKSDFSFEDAKTIITEKFGLKFDADPKDPMTVTAQELEQIKKGFADKKMHNVMRVIVNKKAGIGWNSGNHTALPVLTTSIGCGAENFIGLIENTDISRKLKNLL
ncbi:MAG: alkaline phosphatase [Lentisphaerae bacterium]|nr:alkaline phosphatase [Lentisphaerota bacterium]